MITRETPETNTLWQRHKGLTPLCCAEMSELCASMERQRDKAFDLIREVMSDHRTPDSGSLYNECDDTPCHWCERAKELIGGKS